MVLSGKHVIQCLLAIFQDQREQFGPSLLTLHVGQGFVQRPVFSALVKNVNSVQIMLAPFPDTTRNTNILVVVVCI